jgi:hypothetical protein
LCVSLSPSFSALALVLFVCCFIDPSIHPPTHPSINHTVSVSSSRGFRLARTKKKVGAKWVFCFSLLRCCCVLLCVLCVGVVCCAMSRRCKCLLCGWLFVCVLFPRPL